MLLQNSVVKDRDGKVIRGHIQSDQVETVKNRVKLRQLEVSF